MKYAIVESGGKQYVAREGEAVDVDRLPKEVGRPVEFDRVLLIVDGSKVQVGSPTVRGARVLGTIREQVKGPKVIVFRYIPKERYRRKTGHRQQYTRVVIDSIGGRASQSAAAVEAAALETTAEREPVVREKRPAAREAQPRARASKPPAAGRGPASRTPVAKKKATKTTAKKPTKK